MVEMSGGEALVKSLVNEGVDTVFGIPGIQMYGIVAAIRDEPGIRMITTRHEQATTYMADGYQFNLGYAFPTAPCCAWPETAGSCSTPPSFPRRSSTAST